VKYIIAKIIPESLAQFPARIAILKIEGQKAASPDSASRRVRGMLESKTLMEQIAPALEKVVIKSLHQAPALEAPLLAWPLACGSAVADRTRATEFSRGVLRVEVADAAWRAELQHLAPRYVAIINRYKVGAVSRIDFVIRREPVASDQ
jgi:hypothetical protein